MPVSGAAPSLCPEQMTDIGIYWVFGLALILVIASRVWFRRNPLGTAGRVVLLVVVVALIVIPPAFKGELEATHAAAALAAVVVLGTGILVLRRNNRDSDPQ